MLQDHLGLSQRRACQIVGQHRSTQRHQPAEPDPDRDLRDRLRRFAKRHPRWGYRRAHAVLRREGWAVNRKKVQRLWREEGLWVPPRRHKRQRLGVSTMPADRLRAERPHHVWALDYQFDVTATGRTIKILHVVDEFTRESLADLVDHSIDADTTVACLDKIVGQRGRHPEFIRCDNGPELTANALRDWCRFAGCGTSYIEPGSPWENPWVESYGIAGSGRRADNEAHANVSVSGEARHRSTPRTSLRRSRSRSTVIAGPMIHPVGRVLPRRRRFCPASLAEDVRRADDWTQSSPPLKT
jgi:putative transposase